MEGVSIVTAHDLGSAQQLIEWRQPKGYVEMIAWSSVGPFVVAFVFFFFYHMHGISLGYHRLLSHHSLRIPKWLEYVIVSGAYLAFEGSPIFWVTTHRLHHRYSDHKGDPHSPRDGLFHAFVAWMWDPKAHISDEQSRLLAPDLYRDPLYRILHCGNTAWHSYLCLTAGIVFRAALYFVFGPTVLAANLCATALAFVGPLLVNSICHLRRFGYETYKCADDSRNVLLVALLTMGEGWHNNHHAFPQSVRHGLTKSEFDATWLVVCFLKSLGLADRIHLPKNQCHVAFVDKEKEPVTANE